MASFWKRLFNRRSVEHEQTVHLLEVQLRAARGRADAAENALGVARRHLTDLRRLVDLSNGPTTGRKSSWPASDVRPLFGSRPKTRVIDDPVKADFSALEQRIMADLVNHGLSISRIDPREVYKECPKPFESGQGGDFGGGGATGSWEPSPSPAPEPSPEPSPSPSPSTDY